jgi:hypothetical protein
MGLIGFLRSMLVYSLAIVGFLVVAFVVLSYGWDGEPPQVDFEATEE